ncbi:Zinc metalloproteinase dpy-31 [Folsomia candida]|uniref:Zinc metalloproteinase dpy-31 n=1 Tax=Folsomia candida TaxID=158441 RepID=A0A226D4K6_FOLCA|nr:Zinc metalloproteinase dpy-31 [Folsomia candida]
MLAQNLITILCFHLFGNIALASNVTDLEITFSSGLILPFYLHELGHALGFPHEQDRMDRDDYIYWDKNKKDCKGDDFGGKAGNLDQAALEIRFDYVSLMADWTECYWAKPPMPKDIPLGGGSSDPDQNYRVGTSGRM